MNLFRHSCASGQLVGVQSGPPLAGVVLLAGERLHIHDADAAVSGQIARFSVAAGAVLMLPAR